MNKMWLFWAIAILLAWSLWIVPHFLFLPIIIVDLAFWYLGYKEWVKGYYPKLEQKESEEVENKHPKDMTPEERKRFVHDNFR